MEPCRVVVKKEHIQHAVRRDSHHCMIADAIQAQHAWAKFVVVDVQSIRFSNTETGRRYIYLTPPRAQRALLDFDKGKTPKPFTFTMQQGHDRQMRVRMPSMQKRKPHGRKRNKTPKRYMPARFREMGVRQLAGA